MIRTLLCLMVISLPAYGVDDMYGVLTATYSDTEFNGQSAQSSGYKLAVAYEFHPQWYVEFGYQKIANQSQFNGVPTIAAQLQDAEYGLQGDAIFVALLGKAQGQLGELFYRVGLLNVDVAGQSVTTGSECEIGSGTAFSVEQSNYQFCQYDEGSVAGVLGIGFDFYIGVNTMLRTEVEHIRGQNDLRANVINLGLRYNF